MKSSNLVYSFIMALCLLFSNAEAQQTFHTTPTSVIGYLEYLPQGYASNSDQYPVVIFLHGSGERGSISKDPVEIQKTISLVAKNGPPKHVNSGTQFPFILISPQLKSNLGNWSSSYINEVIDYCKTYLRIDERRIYLTGLSLGGGGTWWDAQDFPKAFAAITPVCGSRNTLTAACNIAAENLPVWAFHGDADPTVPVNRTIKMVNAINACTPTPLAKVTVYAGVGHNAWDNAYRTDHSLHNPNIYEWMLSFTNTVNGSNKIPLVNAGNDITINLASPSVILNGSASDSDGSISTYEWSQLSGPSAAAFSNKTSSIPIVSNLAEGSYVLKLKVTDNGGDINSDYVMLTVLPKPANLPPVVVAGKDSTIILPTNTITLVGTGNDLDGTITSYQWSKVSGAAATLTGASTNALCASSLNAGTYVFRLAVTDNFGATQADDIAVTVLEGSNNILPTVNAGADKIIKLPNTSTVLLGVASDLDGSIVSYSWTKVSGGTCTLSSTTILRPSISNLLSGTYVFRLTVTDNNGGVSSDDVTYIVSNPPTANAGADITITLPTNSVNLSGTGSDSDGTITQYLWGKYTGPTALVTSKNTATTQAVNLLEGTYVFRFTVTDDAGLPTIDYITVTVLPEVAHTSTAARVASANEEEEAQVENSVEQSISLFDLTSESTENNFLVVYNDAGVVLFSGIWKASLYSEVFNHEGLYICNLLRDNKKSSYKLFISRN